MAYFFICVYEYRKVELASRKEAITSILDHRKGLLMH